MIVSCIIISYTIDAIVCYRMLPYATVCYRMYLMCLTVFLIASYVSYRVSYLILCVSSYVSYLMCLIVCLILSQAVAERGWQYEYLGISLVSGQAAVRITAV